MFPLVRIFNPLSSDLNSMRKDMLFGGLEAISYNTNRKNADLRLYEFGNVYHYHSGVKSENALDKYLEEEHLGLFLTGEKFTANWTGSTAMTSFYQMKSFVGLVLKRLGFDPGNLRTDVSDRPYFSEGLRYRHQRL